MTPIKPGTARRLGLRSPQPHPVGFLTFHTPISDEEAEQLKANIKAAVRQPYRLMALPESSEFRHEPTKRPSKWEAFRRYFA